MLRKPNDRTPADKLGAEIEDVFKGIETATQIPTQFGERMWEHHASTLQLRGGQYIDPDDISHESTEGDEICIYTDWEDTRLHVNIYDYAEESDEEAVLVMLDYGDADQNTAWVVTPDAVEDGLVSGFDVGKDDDWELFSVEDRGEELLHRILDRASVRIVDCQDIMEQQPYTPVKNT